MATPLKSLVKRPKKPASGQSLAPKKNAAKSPAKSSAKRVPAKAKVRSNTAKLKVVAKKPVSKTPSLVKTTSVRAPTRDTLATLRSHVDQIEQRLKRANSLTRTSVRALKTSYETLEGDTRTTELTQHIEKLSSRLTSMIEQTRQDVGHDLRIVLNDPRLVTLSSALTKANQRLTATELQQAEAINSINSHIARLATVVDARMQREERQRQKGEALLTSRMDSIERDSANAIKSIGENIVRVSEDVSEKTESLKGELAEQAIIQQQNYANHKHKIAQRIEALEDEQRNQLPAFERNIAKLSTRLEALEDNIDVFGNQSKPGIEASKFEGAPQIPEHNQEKISEQLTEEERKPKSAASKVDDAFAALELVNKQDVAKPEKEAQTIVPILASEAVQHGQPYAPVEYVGDVVDGENTEIFSPRAYVPVTQNEVQQATHSDIPTATHTSPQSQLDPLSNEPQIYTPPTADNSTVTPQIYGEPETYVQTPPPMPSAKPYTELPPMPVSEELPEISLVEPSMESVRPGAEPTGKPTKSKKFKFKKRTSDGGNNGDGGNMIRKLALFGGVAIVALFAYKAFAPKIFSSDNNALKSTQIVKTQQLAQVFDSASEGVVVSNRITFETTKPVGDYSETMAAPDLSDESTQIRAGKSQTLKQTLEEAASGGNAVAQFQLGLSHLEAGRNEEAVRLIRLSANQGQPAAQYRLAKLYEAGIEVQVNGKTAKDLLSRSAEAGNRIAMHDLGHYFATGADGSSPDLQQAVKWFSMAAERGVLDSQFNLAVLYQGGSGVPLSLENAYVWYAIAGVQGDKIAVQRSEAIALELTEDQLSNAKNRVKVFAPKPVNNNANGVFKNLPWVAQKKASANPSLSTGIKGAQQMLASLGYPVGTPDGSLGPNTRNAIISFERANGLPETGRVNAVLIEKLQMAVGV